MLDYATPVSRYTASRRDFPDTLPLPVYADDVLVRRVSAKGTIRVKSRHVADQPGPGGARRGPAANDG